MPPQDSSQRIPDEPRRPIRIAIVGDYNPSVTAHRAIPEALRLGAERLGLNVQQAWISTPDLESRPAVLNDFDGVWLTPASPYVSMTGALEAARFARENNVPFLGTCGGFQHALIEFARNVAGLAGAGHAETAPDANTLVVQRLSCSLVEKEGTLYFTPSTLISESYRLGFAVEGYHCNYCLNEEFRGALEGAGLRFTATDEKGAVRAFELPSNRFFVGTLFQPERAALRGEVPPLVKSFLEAISAGL
jgi:CTP synthase